MKNYIRNFDEVLQKIESARIEADEHRIIKIVAASKYVDSNEIKKMYEIGQRAFGENKIQDLKNKSSNLINLPIEWHYIGKIQTNKINTLLDREPFLIHSIESFEMAMEVEKKAKVKNKSVDVLLQINSANEDSKGGCLSKDARDIYIKIKENCKYVNLKGVMSIGAHSSDLALIEKSFKDTYEIFDSLKSHGAKYCSMGMSNDYELAIKCGSNMLRLGSVLFK
jgi:pyridoxal phosphate enzyme (YggS family)